MATQCRGTKTKRINRHKLAVIQAYIIIGTLVLIGFIGGLVVGRATAPKKQVTVRLCGLLLRFLFYWRSPGLSLILKSRPLVGRVQ